MLTYEMLAGRSPFDIAHAADNPDQNTEDYLFQVGLFLVSFYLYVRNVIGKKYSVYGTEILECFSKMK